MMGAMSETLLLFGENLYFQLWHGQTINFYKSRLTDSISLPHIPHTSTQPTHPTNNITIDINIIGMVLVSDGMWLKCY